MNTRIAYLDIAKFMGLIAVIFGHFGVPDINRFVYSFHIPLFFLISGYFFYPTDRIAEVILKKGKQLIVPYIVVMFSVLVINGILLTWQKKSLEYIFTSQWNYFLGYLYGSGYIDIVLGHKIQTVGPIWFCLALFWDFLFLTILVKYKNIFLNVLLFFIAGYYSAKYIWLPFSIQSAMTGLLFFYIGYVAKQKKWLKYQVSFVSAIPLLCLWGIGLSYGGQFLLVQNSSVFLITDIITAICASYLVILYAKWLDKNTSSAKMMAFLGKYTIIMLCFHSIDVVIMPWNAYYKIPNTGSNVILIKIGITIFKFLFPIFGAVIVSKTEWLKKFFNLKS